MILNQLKKYRYTCKCNYNKIDNFEYNTKSRDEDI